MSALASRSADRLNPVFVKEVRAAMRARGFGIVFQLVVLGTMLVSVIALATLDPAGDTAARDFFQPVYACLCAALLGWIPLSAFFAMASEWDESAYDLLAISNLRPRQIVLGKLLTSAIQALLCFSAFAPVLVLAFLLRGIDIGLVLAALAMTLVASIGASAAAIGISSLARSRVLRVLLLLVLAGLLFLLIVFVVQMVVFRLLRGSGFTLPFFRGFLMSVLLLTGGAGLLGFGIACERLAHPEENHSTGPRVIVTVMYAIYLLWAVIEMGSNWYAGGAAIGLTLVTIGHVFFVTENESLSRRVQRQVPRSGGLALLSTPFFPGGGRAIFLFGVHVAMAVLFGLLGESLRRGPLYGEPVWMFRHAFAFLVFAGYLFVYLAGFSLPFSRRTSEPRVRWIARVTVPIVALLSIFAPSIVDFLLSQHRFVEMRHPLNPFWIIGYDTNDVTLSRICVVLVPLAVVVGLANLPRLDHAWREVQKASRENRERASA